MKKAAILLASISLLCTGITFGQAKYHERPTNTELGKFLKTQGKYVIEKNWEIEEIKAEERISIYFYAVEAHLYDKPNEVKKGLKVKIVNTNKTELETIKVTFEELDTYIDKSEFTDILIAIDNMQKTLSGINKNDFDTRAYYNTLDNFSFGFNEVDKKEMGFAGIWYDEAKLFCDIKKSSTFFSALKDVFDTVSTELYLQENYKKMKKGKKSTEDTDEVIDTDI